MIERAIMALNRRVRLAHAHVGFSKLEEGVVSSNLTSGSTQIARKALFKGIFGLFLSADKFVKC